MSESLQRQKRETRPNSRCMLHKWVWLHTLSPDKLVEVMQFFATSACNCKASLRLRRAHKCSFTILGTWAPSRTAFICTKSRPCRAAVGPRLCQCRMKDIQGDKMSLITPSFWSTGPIFVSNLFKVCMCIFRDQKLVGQRKIDSQSPYSLDNADTADRDSLQYCSKRTVFRDA